MLRSCVRSVCLVGVLLSPIPDGASIAHAQQAPIAESFDVPAAGFSGGSYGNRVLGVGSPRHLGEDHAASPGTPVRAVANGVILPSPISGPHCNYGMVVAIQHTLPDGSKVVSVMGHLSNREGMKPRLSGTVYKGEVIGYVGHSGGKPPKAGCKNDDENGDGGPHVHAGLRLGAAPGGWVYYGYKTGSEDLASQGGKWVSISNFIEDHRAVSSCQAKVTSLAPARATLGRKTLFEAQGTCLPDGAAAWIAECSGLRIVARHASRLVFECTPETRGAKRTLVKDRPGGTVLFDASVTVQ